jgi:hypothetical protein
MADAEKILEAREVSEMPEDARRICERKREMDQRG